MRHTDTIIQKLKNNPKIDDKDNCSYRVRSAKDVIENAYAPIDVLNIDVQGLSDSDIAIIQNANSTSQVVNSHTTSIAAINSSVTALDTRMGAAETNITNLNTRLPSTIRFRVNGTTLQASVDSGSTWKNVVVG